MTMINIVAKCNLQIKRIFKPSPRHIPSPSQVWLGLETSATRNVRGNSILMKVLIPQYVFISSNCSIVCTI